MVNDVRKKKKFWAKKNAFLGKSDGNNDEKWTTLLLEEEEKKGLRRVSNLFSLFQFSSTVIDEVAHYYIMLMVVFVFSFLFSSYIICDDRNLLAEQWPFCGFFMADDLNNNKLSGWHF